MQSKPLGNARLESYSDLKFEQTDISKIPSLKWTSYPNGLLDSTPNGFRRRDSRMGHQSRARQESVRSAVRKNVPLRSQL